MECRIIAFGISREIIGSKHVAANLPEESTVAELKAVLIAHYPALADLQSMYIAVNNEYAEADQILKSGDEIALIPPVNGG